MKAVLGWLLVLAIAVWIVDSSGCGYTKWSDSGSRKETDHLLEFTPVSAYIRLGKTEGVTTDFASTKDLIQALQTRRKGQRYSILGRKIVDKNPPAQANVVMLKFYNHDGYQPWLKFADATDDLGPESASYLKDVVFKYPVPMGWQTPQEPEISRVRL